MNPGTLRLSFSGFWQDLQIWKIRRPNSDFQKYSSLQRTATRSCIWLFTRYSRLNATLWHDRLVSFLLIYLVLILFFSNAVKIGGQLLFIFRRILVICDWGGFNLFFCLWFGIKYIPLLCQTMWTSGISALNFKMMKYIPHISVILGLCDLDFNLQWSAFFQAMSAAACFMISGKCVCPPGLMMKVHFHFAFFSSAFWCFCCSYKT